MKTNEQIARELLIGIHELSAHNAIQRITQALNAKDARIKRLEEALRFYSEDNNWPQAFVAPDDLWCDALSDGGAIAIEALQGR